MHGYMRAWLHFEAGNETAEKLVSDLTRTRNEAWQLEMMYAQRCSIFQRLEQWTDRKTKTSMGGESINREYANTLDDLAELLSKDAMSLVRKYLADQVHVEDLLTGVPDKEQRRKIYQRLDHAGAPLLAKISAKKKAIRDLLAALQVAHPTIVPEGYGSTRSAGSTSWHQSWERHVPATQRVLERSLNFDAP